MERDLPEIEKRALEFIQTHGIVMTKEMPKNLSGAVPNLINKGLIEIFKQKISPLKGKKHKFVKTSELE
jgi:hypothetical protein